MGSNCLYLRYLLVSEHQRGGCVGVVAASAFGIGVLGSAFLFGFRHGIDWDHLAAITDITSSQEDRRLSVLFGTIYALGHALVVFLIGTAAILIGEKLPEGVDAVMGRIVGFTLILLGVYVFVSLIRHGRDFRLRSRWMLIFSGVRRGVRWAKGKVRSRDTAMGGGPAVAVAAGEEMAAPSWHHGHHGRPGHHHHAEPEPDDAFMNYGQATAFGVGMIHGIGAETPTQLLIFLSAAGAGGTGVGIVVLLSFIVGLLSSNTLITLGSAFGFLRASKNFPLYAGVAIVTGVFSLVIGTIFLFGKTTLLPAL